MSSSIYAMTVFEAVIAVLAITGNSMVIASVIKYHQLRTLTNYLIVNLALADLLVGAVGIPCVIVSMYGYPTVFYGCLFVNIVIIALTQISIFGLLVIAFERFVAIKYPFEYNKYGSGNVALAASCVAWVCGVACGFGALYGWNREGSYLGECSFVAVVDLQYMVYFNFFVCVLVPLCIMGMLYCYIFSVIRRLKRQVTDITQCTETTSVDLHTHHGFNRSFVRESRSAKWLGIVLAVFIFCWLPIHIMNAVSVFAQRTSGVWVSTAALLSHANSAINPVLYAFANSKFKNAFKKILGLRINPNGRVSIIGPGMFDDNMH